jgi:hypothetical protein
MSRIITVYTPNFHVEPYKIVYDSSKDKKKDAHKVADSYDKRPAEDSDTKVFYVQDHFSNGEVLNFLGSVMEIATNKQLKLWDIILKSNKKRNDSRTR